MAEKGLLRLNICKAVSSRLSAFGDLSPSFLYFWLSKRILDQLTLDSVGEKKDPHSVTSLTRDRDRS